MTIHEIRKSFLDFFLKEGHGIVASSSLLPDNDPTTLFTGSGMQPMISFLLGESHPGGKRLADSQKCFRSQDIDEVGDNRHTTFFEMLGNWSLGDYFKEEQLPWVFTWLTEEIGINPNNLYVTVFSGNNDIERDTTSAGIWQKIYEEVGMQAPVVDNAEEMGMQNGRIFYYGEKQNWWSRAGIPDRMPSGEPGGPDSEMFYDFGVELKIHESSPFSDELCHVNCDCGRFLEIGNNVFMEYQKTDTGFEPLSQRNVDFGGGLERIAAAAANTPDVFQISAFDGMRTALEIRSNLSYADEKQSFRVILDHIRAAVFLMSDGAMPSNKDQGYFVRRLIRRSVRFGRKIGIDGLFVAEIGQEVIEEYGSVYANLREGREEILSELTKEEKKFLQTLDKGEKEFLKMFKVSQSITGQDAFVLYSTYGFPLELTEEMAAEKGQVVDRVRFSEEFLKHQELSRAGGAQKFAGGLADHSKTTVRLHTATHMLHQALRTVLGDHVQQKGSNITAKRLRFDFSHPDKLTDIQKQEVEQLVNENIQKDLPIHFELIDFETAKKQGAIGLFEDTYSQIGDKLKVYFIGNEATQEYYSKEVCGGPHVQRTGELGRFSIKKEESSSSGIRRIKAILD